MGLFSNDRRENTMTGDVYQKSMILIVQATLIAGVLDIGSAFVYAVLDGRSPRVVLIGIASALWPGAVHAGLAGAFTGLLLHFAIMCAMVAIYMMATSRIRWTGRRPILSGGLYGLILWAVMNLIVLPLRWPALFPHLTTVGVTEQLFSHVILVGIPIAWLARSRQSPLRQTI